jgi:DNA-binding NarL/FixJ family response regulator
MSSARVLLADDHKILGEGLRSLLEPEFELVGIVEDGRALIEAAVEYRPDVIVVDISMPLLNGIEAVRHITKLNPAIKFVFLTMHTDVIYATKAFAAGAVGYVLKQSAASELLTAIREALKGRMYVTPLIAKDLLQAYVDRAHAPSNSPLTLTPRQREVMQLLAEGHSAKEVAAILKISARTAEFHKYRAMEILGLRSSAELIHYAIKHGIAAV